MSATIVDFPERKQVAEESLTWPQKARAATVTDGPSYERTSRLLLGIKALRQKVSEVFDPHIKRAFDAHRALTAEKNAADRPLIEAEGIIKRSLADFQAAQERERREKQRIADEAARKKAEDDRIVRAAAMEREAKAFGDAALQAEAEALVSQPAEVVVAPTVAAETPRVAGISHRANWCYRITDVNLLPREYLTPDEKKIGAVVRAMKDGTNIPGIVVFNEPTVAASAR